MAKPDRRENRAERTSDESMKSLIDEYMASTREPVGSRDLFRETPVRSQQANAGARAGGRDEVVSARPSAIMLYLLCMAVLLIAALAIGFL
ncbi:MAG TPA: hypothetical protein VJ790_21135 [Dongiaceae bacterium]|nr:hypothetical protein [Dongiaceae bacterium]